MNVKNEARSGFTLIELLVAIAIIAVIAAILFPVFASVRERGRRTVCQSNLKQIATAMQQYVQDNGGVYPSIPSDWGYAPYSYLRNADVFRCPDHAPNENEERFSLNPPVALSTNRIVEGVTAPVDYTYNMPRFTIFEPPFPTKSIHGAHEASLVTPSTIWFNVDAGWSDADGDHYVRTVSTSCGRTFIGRTLHSGAANYSYVDGHVKWLTPEEAGEIECANGPLPAPFKD
jgi:prepilin-type N-terminal cleavage/methylation domain-containing protein/prepilin-type processing-associated H-X9-DG protein